MSPPLSSLLNCHLYSTSVLLTTAPPPARPAPDARPSRITDDDIPPELFDEVATPAGGDSRTSAAVRVCPHCTFENANGGNDCEVCGLPL